MKYKNQIVYEKRNTFQCLGGLIKPTMLLKVCNLIACLKLNCLDFTGCYHIHIVVTCTVRPQVDLKFILKVQN